MTDQNPVHNSSFVEAYFHIFSIPEPYKLKF